MRGAVRFRSSRGKLKTRKTSIASQEGNGEEEVEVETATYN